MVFCDIIMYNTIVVQRIWIRRWLKADPSAQLSGPVKERLEVRSRRILESINLSRMEETV